MGFQKGGVLAVRDKTIREEVKEILNTHPLSFRESIGKYGLIFSIKLRPGDTPFIDLHTEQPVRSLILKIGVIYNSPDKYTVIINGKSQRKTFIDRDEFLNESKTQQYVWANSISNGGKPLCPPIIDNMTIDTSNMCDFSAKSSLRRFFDNVIIPVGVPKIAVMIMPMVPNNPNDFFEWFMGEVEGKPILTYPNLMMAVCSNIVSQMLRMFLEIRVVNLDLNDGNILVFKNGKPILKDRDINIGNNPYDTIFLDFGYCANFSDPKSDASFSQAEKEDMNKTIDLFLTDLTSGKITQNKKPQVVNIILNQIIEINIEAMKRKHKKLSEQDLLQHVPLLNFRQKFDIFEQHQVPGFNITQVFVGAYDLLIESLQHRDNTKYPISELNDFIRAEKMYDYGLGDSLAPAPSLAPPPLHPPPPPALTPSASLAPGTTTLPLPPPPSSPTSSSGQTQSVSLQQPTPSRSLTHSPLSSPLPAQPSTPPSSTLPATQSGIKRIKPSTSIGGKNKRHRKTRSSMKQRKHHGGSHKRKKSINRRSRKTKRQ
jgi:hypothetical protein